MIAPLLRHLSPEGDGAHCDNPRTRLYSTIANGGCPSGGGGAPESGFIARLIFLTFKLPAGDIGEKGGDTRMCHRKATAASSRSSSAVFAASPSFASGTVRGSP